MINLRLLRLNCLRSFASESSEAVRQQGIACSLSAAYKKDVRDRSLQFEACQKACIGRLDSLLEDLVSQQQQVQAYNSLLRSYLDRRKAAVSQLHKEDQQRAAQRRENWLYSRLDSWFPGERKGRKAVQAEREQKIDALIGHAPERPSTTKGVYIYGSVGTGKTMLMDRFYAAAECFPGLLHRRMHFNTALLEVHSRMHAYEQEAKRKLLSGAKDMNEEIAVLDKQAKRAKLAIRRFLRQRSKQTAEELSLSLAETNANIFSELATELMGAEQIEPSSRDADFQRLKMHTGVLCFDEININDPFTALALKGIFESLIDSGVVIVATSNRAPWDLNLQGVHEAIFAHFKAKLMDSCEAVSVECEDFRRKADSGQTLGTNYLLGTAKHAEFQEVWQEALANEGYQQPEPTSIPILFGRSLQVDQSAGGIAKFAFLDLCDKPKGPSDYHAISKRYHTVFISDIPIMTFQMRNMARRFITLLDELYNARCRLVCTADGRPEDLFATSRDGDAALFDAEQLEQLQFESAAEGSRLRRDVMTQGGVAPVFGAGTATVTTTFLGGLEETFAFARAVSRMYEMSRMKPRPPSHKQSTGVHFDKAVSVGADL